MRTPRIFLDRSIQINDYIELGSDTSHRLATVLRLAKDMPIILFNNDNYEYLCSIFDIKRNKIGLKVLEKISKNIESPLKIHLGQVISKGEKMDFVIQKATELGVYKITPLFSERGIVLLKHERLEKKTEHWQKIAIHAAEQCGRTFVPIIANPIGITEWVHGCSEQNRLVLDPMAANSLATIEMIDSVALLIGPEGGLSIEEIEFAKDRGFQKIKLGPRILRTETAALTIIAAIQYKAGDLCF
jgi:16S rRNA (uracil1498-N3)-methyltransferase